MRYSMIFEGLEISYIRQSDNNPKFRILLVHGTGCDSRVFLGLLSELSKNHDVIAIDLPGHGNSSGIGFRGVADYAAFCSALVQHVGWEDCVLVGHSMGGGVSIAMTLYDSQLVRGLILIDSGARLRVSPEVLDLAKKEAAEPQKRKKNSRVGFSDKTADSIIKNIREITDNSSALVTFKDWIADDTCDFMSRVSKIELPTLAICGREDVLTPLKYHQYLEERMPDCSLVVIEDAGHWPFVEKPKEVLTALEVFLEKLN